MSDASDDALFTQVARELAARKVVEGLWTKAFALENGDDRKAKAHYIRLRVAQLQQQQHPSSQPAEPVVEPDPIAPEVEPTPALANESQAVESQVPVSLWARFWARNIDYLLCMALFLLLSSALANTGNVLVNLLIAFVVPGIVLVGYDAILLSVFGKTIGKAIFGLSVESHGGGNLLFGDALRRSFKVWIFGNGCYLFFPMAPAFMWWGARKSLAATGGHASWDAACNSRVAQPPIGGARFAFGSALGVVALSVAIGVSIMVKDYNKRMLRESISAPPATSPASVVEHGPWEQFLKEEPAPASKPLRPFEKRNWSGNIFEQFSPPQEIEIKARAIDSRLNTEQGWKAVLSWKSAYMRLLDYDESLALYAAVDMVLQNLANGRGYCTEFFFSPAIGSFEAAIEPNCR